MFFVAFLVSTHESPLARSFACPFGVCSRVTSRAQKKEKEFFVRQGHECLFGFKMVFRLRGEKDIQLALCVCVHTQPLGLYLLISL